MSDVTDGFAKNLAECKDVNIKFLTGRLKIQFDISPHNRFFEICVN